MTALRPHRVLALLVAAGLAAALVVVAARHRLESQYRTVTIVLDGEAWEHLAAREGRTGEVFWREARARGANGIALYDQTLKRLAETYRARYFDGATLRELLRARAAPPAAQPLGPDRVSRSAVYVVYDDEAVGRLLRTGFQLALGHGRVHDISGVTGILEIAGRLRDLEETGLGFLADDVRTWERRGFEVLLRPRNVRGADAARLTARIASYEELGRGRTFIPELTDVIGFERLVKESADALRSINGRYGRIEILAQQRRIKGEEALTRHLRPAVIRVFSLTPEELDRFDVPDAVDRYTRAARERNIRLLYVRPFLNTTAGIDPVAANLGYVEALAARARDAGFAIGPAAPLVPLGTRWPVYGALLLGASASVALVAAIAADLAGWRANAKLWPALAGAAALLGLAASVAGFDGLVRKSLALGASVAFPTLALYLGFPAPSRGAALSVPRAAAFAVGRLWAVSVGSLLGGLLIGALLAEWRFMLAFDQFPGVKVAAVAPVLAFAALWILRWERSLPAGERRGLIARLWASLERPLSWRHAVVALSISVIALLLLVRSGNTSLPLVGIEERLRHFVEDAFVARPRTKEYLFGHPLLLIALAAAAIRLPNLAFPLALVGSVGQTGLVNSFCHLHTPLVYALWRTANALVLGTSVGIAGVAISAAVWGRWGGWARRTAARAGAR